MCGAGDHGRLEYSEREERAGPCPQELQHPMVHPGGWMEEMEKEPTGEAGGKSRRSFLERGRGQGAEGR